MQRRRQFALQRQGQRGDGAQDVELRFRHKNIAPFQHIPGERDVALRRAGGDPGHIGQDQQRAGGDQHGAHRFLVLAAACQRLQQAGMEQVAGGGDGRHQKQDDEYRRPFGGLVDQAGDHAGDGEDGAVRDIEDAGNAVDERQAEGDEGVDAAEQQPGDEYLRQHVERHAVSPRTAPARPPGAIHSRAERPVNLA